MVIYSWGKLTKDTYNHKESFFFVFNSCFLYLKIFFPKKRKANCIRINFHNGFSVYQIYFFNNRVYMQTKFIMFACKMILRYGYALHDFILSRKCSQSKGIFELSKIRFVIRNHQLVIQKININNMFYYMYEYVVYIL